MLGDPRQDRFHSTIYWPKIRLLSKSIKDFDEDQFSVNIGIYDEVAKDWNSRLCILSTLAEKHSQAAYAAFISDFENKVSCFMRTISMRTIRYLATANR